MFRSHSYDEPEDSEVGGSLGDGLPLLADGVRSSRSLHRASSSSQPVTVSRALFGFVFGISAVIVVLLLVNTATLGRMEQDARVTCSGGQPHSTDQREDRKHICPPASTSAFASASELRGLLSLLESERSLLRSYYPSWTAFDSPAVRFATQASSESTVVSTALTRSLTDTFFGRRPIARGPAFVIGVTGGSSTAGSFSWPHRLGNWLHDRLHLNVSVRNGAQGGTSQLQTAACIHQIAGDIAPDVPLDLLMWEFGMNDEYNWLKRHYSRPPSLKTRVARERSAELWVRAVASQPENRPLAVGFVHFWDLSIDDWDIARTPFLPELSWAPTNRVLAHYRPVLDAFAVNTMRFLHEFASCESLASVEPRSPRLAGCRFHNTTLKSDLLRDRHHPTYRVYDISVDLLVLAILDQWIPAVQWDLQKARHLEAQQQAHATRTQQPEQPEPQTDRSPVAAVPVCGVFPPPPFVRSSVFVPYASPVPSPLISLSAHPDDLVDLPAAGVFGTCLVAHLPQFSGRAPKHLEPLCANGNPMRFNGSTQIGFTPLCAGVERVQTARPFGDRADTKFFYPVPSCTLPPSQHLRIAVASSSSVSSAASAVPSLVTSADPDASVVSLCWRYLLLECKESCSAARVSWDGHLIAPNRIMHQSMFDAWVHEFEPDGAHTQQTHMGDTHMLSLCAVNMTRVPPVHLTRLSAWFKPSH